MKRRYPYGLKSKYKHRPISKRRRYPGLVPQYVGFNPRQFALGEWKYNDLTATVAADSGTPAYILLNGLVPGTTATTRIGTNINIRSFEARLHAYADEGTGVTTLVRYIFVVDRQPNALALTSSVVLTDSGGYNGVRNLSYRKRFKILVDKTVFTMKSGQSADENFRHLYYKFKRPLRTEYNVGTAGTIGDITTNSLYLIILATKTGTENATVKYNIRVRYTDM